MNVTVQITTNNDICFMQCSGHSSGVQLMPMLVMHVGHGECECVRGACVAMSMWLPADHSARDRVGGSRRECELCGLPMQDMLVLSVHGATL